MTQVLGFVGTNRGFSRALRDLQKLAMRGATFQADQDKIARVIRKAKMLDLAYQIRGRGPQNAA